tara:strand:+ start:736 stop:1485 length:750 start_codon:yes stop_codon:yes gene_type:complete
MEQAVKSLSQTDLTADVREKILELVKYTEYVKKIEEERRIKEEEKFEKEFQILEKEYRKLFPRDLVDFHSEFVSEEGEQQKDEKKLQKQNDIDELQHRLEVERNQWQDDFYEEHVRGKRGGKSWKKKEKDDQNDMMPTKKWMRKERYQPRDRTQYAGISSINILNPYLVSGGMYLSANIGRLRTPVSDLVMPEECQEEIRNLRQQRAALEAEITEWRKSNRILLEELMALEGKNNYYGGDTDGDTDDEN